jgi:hypothetical protein
VLSSMSRWSVLSHRANLGVLSAPDPTPPVSEVG